VDELLKNPQNQVMAGFALVLVVLLIGWGVWLLGRERRLNAVTAAVDDELAPAVLHEPWAGWLPWLADLLQNMFSGWGDGVQPVKVAPEEQNITAPVPDVSLVAELLLRENNKPSPVPNVVLTPLAVVSPPQPEDSGPKLVEALEKSEAEKKRRRLLIIDALAVRRDIDDSWMYTVAEIRDLVSGDINKLTVQVREFRDAEEKVGADAAA
jgi:hypothetical protein